MTKKTANSSRWSDKRSPSCQKLEKEKKLDLYLQIDWNRRMRLCVKLSEKAKKSKYFGKMKFKISVSKAVDNLGIKISKINIG